MASITVKTNGQTLTVNADISHWTSAALAVTASGDDDVESTTTTTITSDYTMHFANTATTATITVKQLDGTTLLAQAFPVTPGHGPRTLNPVPDQYQVAADSVTSYLETQAVTEGEETFPRMLYSATATMTSGVLRLAYFTCRRPTLVERLSVATGGTAAAATPTLVRLGLYTADSAGALTALVASTVNDTGLLASTHTEEIVETAASYQMVVGTRYALGCLVVTGATAPILAANSGGNAASVLAPRIAAQVNSQSDLPATVASGSLTLSPALIWGRCLPAT